MQRVNGISISSLSIYQCLFIQVSIYPTHFQTFATNMFLLEHDRTSVSKSTHRLKVVIYSIHILYLQGPDIQHMLKRTTLLQQSKKQHRQFPDLQVSINQSINQSNSWISRGSQSIKQSIWISQPNKPNKVSHALRQHKQWLDHNAPMLWGAVWSYPMRVTLKPRT